MRAVVDLFRREPQARLFFIAHLQSSLGTGAGYAALLILAYERFESPWAVTALLLADFLPAMLLGPLFGAAADRWSRRGCAIAADVARAAAFIGLCFADGLGTMFALALVAGAGSGLFVPAAMAGLPSLVERERLPAATSVFGVLTDLGWLVGPALGAIVLLFAGPEALLFGNGVTFGLSALVLMGLKFGQSPKEEARDGEDKTSLLGEAREGLRAVAKLPGVRVVILVSGAIVLVGGMMNVAEVALAEDELKAGAAGFSILVAAYGGGVALGSLTGSAGGSLPTLRRKMLAGLLIQSLALVCSAAAPVLAIAVLTFALTGLGDGMAVVHQRLLLQLTVPDRLMARVFGVRDALCSWGFAAACLGAGGIVSLAGARVLFAAIGIGTLLVWAVAALSLRRLTADSSGPLRPTHAAVVVPAEA